MAAAKPNEPGGQPWDAPGGRSRVAGSSFNGGWRWWLGVACCVLAIVEGWVAIGLGVGMLP